ncbi:hypothetical protein [Bacillus thuringiensis]|uniref:hypothetical protein n=1 Tax=Bacillus thuringiensis TaxID=1428 RepID=UPI0021D691F6|nr:hypothetical protein [Bacillus thuringiensis]MCU7667615.1 hypothetical protein [Bacillus thuringiensis]
MQLNLTYYTKPSFFECFPEATENDWQAYLISDSYEMTKKMEERTGRKITQVRKVFISEEYFEWLRENKKENTTENRLEFMNSRTDKDVERLWRKYNKHDWIAYVYTIPFVIAAVGNEFVPKNTIEISKALINKLQNKISKICIVPKKDVLIHPELVRGDEFVNEFGNKFDDAAEKFFSGDKYNLKAKSSLFAQEQKHANLGFRFLPVSVKLEDAAIMTLKDLEREEKRDFAFEGSFIDYVAEEIKKQMGGHFTLVTGFENPVIGAYIPEFMDEFINDFINMENDKKVDFFIRK